MGQRISPWDILTAQELCHAVCQEHGRLSTLCPATRVLFTFLCPGGDHGGDHGGDRGVSRQQNRGVSERSRAASSPQALSSLVFPPEP